MRKFRAVIVIALGLPFFAMARQAAADSVTVRTAAPSTSQELVVSIYAFEPSFPYYNHQYRIQREANTFSIYLCRSSGGFATAGLGLNLDASLGYLETGTYAVNTYAADCDSLGISNLSSVLAGTSFAVGSDPGSGVPIPTASPLAELILSLGVMVVGITRLRGRPNFRVSSLTMRSTGRGAGGPSARLRRAG